MILSAKLLQLNHDVANYPSRKLKIRIVTLSATLTSAPCSRRSLRDSSSLATWIGFRPEPLVRSRSAPWLKSSWMFSAESEKA